MGVVHFHLKEPNSSKLTSIVLVYWLKNERIKYHTNEKVLPAHWLRNIQRADETAEFKGYKKVNKNLVRYLNFVDNLIELAKFNKTTLTKEYIKESLDKEFKAFKREAEIGSSPKINLMTYIDQFINECNSGKKLTPNGKMYKQHTIKGFKTIVTHLKNYQEYSHVKLDFKDITLDFYDDFLKYFNDNQKRINTIGKNVKNLKTIMHHATEDGYNSNLEYQRKKFKVINEESDKIYLSEEELSKIYNHDLSSNKRLENVRDLFIIAAYTALRFGDLEKLTGENFVFTDKMNYLKVTTQKTEVNVIIPLRNEVLTIYNKYNGKLPRCVSNQKMNEYLKEIGEKAGIKDKVLLSTTKGGMRFDESLVKYQLITTHTARRSAATNMYLAGVPTISIMKITGHKTEKAFLKYIRISQEDNALKLSEHPFFKNEGLRVV
jgi:integrase